MATLQTHLTERGRTHEGSTTGADSRTRLLEGLPVTERRLRLNGISTAVLEGGDGPPVVLLHGPGEYAAKWLRVIPDLVATHRVIVPDLPGHGESDPVDGPVDADRILGWLDDLIECTCSTPPALVGQILGGAIAARFAIERGERISSLVLVDALGLAPFQPAPEFASALTDFGAEPTEDSHDRLWSRCAFDLDTLRGRMGEKWGLVKAYNLDRAREPRLRDTQHGLMAVFAMPALPAEQLAQIGVPTALVWGRHDLATPLSVARSASARYGWPLHVIEKAADDPPIEQPEAFVDVLRAMLDARDPNGVSGDPAGKSEWDEIAPGYDRTNTPSQMWIAGEGLRRAGLASGMRFLDVASGSGALSIPAARLGARVLATDLSPVMLQLLRSRAAREHLDVETRVMDGHALELDDDSCDMAGSQFGVMLFPDVSQGVREMTRVVKPGGRVLIHAYGDPHEIEFLSFLVRAVQAVRPDFDGPPADPPPLEFQLSDPDRLHSVLSAAGLKNVQVETVVETTEHENGKDLWDWLVWSNPLVERVLGGMLALTADERRTVQKELEKLVRERAGGEAAARLTNPVHIGFGTK